MKPLISFTNWRACVLGAINGLLFGAVAEAARQISNRNDIERALTAAKHDGISTPQIADMLHWHFIPLLFILLFTISSYVVHRTWHASPKLLLLFWEVIGVLPICLFILADLFIHMLSNQKFPLRTLQLWGLSLAIAIVVNFLYGVVIHLALSTYCPMETTKYN